MATPRQPQRLQSHSLISGLEPLRKSLQGFHNQDRYDSQEHDDEENKTPHTHGTQGNNHNQEFLALGVQLLHGVCPLVILLLFVE
jgi:hypothetical protein